MATLIYLLYAGFFSNIDLFYIIRSYSDLKVMQRELVQMRNQEARARQELYQLTHDPNYLERYARETYYMSRPNEDVFVFVEKK